MDWLTVTSVRSVIAFERGMGHQEVAFVGSRVNSVGDDVLQGEGTVRTLVSSDQLHILHAHIAFLVQVTFRISFNCHFGMQMIQDPLELANAARRRIIVLFIMSRISDEIQELGVQVIEALVGSDSTPAERNEGAGGKCISRCPLV